MSNIFAGSSLFLLQQDIKFSNENDPLIALIIVIAAAAVIIISIIVRLLRRIFGKSVPGRQGKRSAKRFSGFSMRRIASDYSLTRKQKQFLEAVFKHDGVGDPLYFVSNHEALDRLFMRGIRSAEKNSANTEEYERYVSEIFTLRNIFETTPANESGSFGEAVPNTNVTLVSGNTSYTVKVVSSGRSGVIVESPKAKFGTTINLANGERVSLFCNMNSPNGFSIDCKVSGTKNTDKGSFLQIAFTGKPKALAQRRFRRKQAKASCNLFIVQRTQAKGKSRRGKSEKLVAGTSVYKSTLNDISIGGCAIYTSAPVHGGSMLKIEFNFSGDSSAVLGQVLRSNRSSSAKTGTIVHVKFVKIPRRAFNNINFFIFDYDRS